MKRRALLTLCCGSLLALSLAWPGVREHCRLASIRQTVPLTDTLSMKVEDAWVYPVDAKHELLRVQVTYVGGNPNTDYHMSAEIGRSPGDHSFAHVLHWQVGLPGGDLAKCWEFQNFPRDGCPITVTLHLRPKSGGKEVVRSFSIPDWLRVTPNGEVPTVVAALSTRAR